MAHELKNAMSEIRKHHPGIWEEHIKKLLEAYTVSEIIEGHIKNGVFYPTYEVGKHWQNKKPLTPMILWQPRKKSLRL